MKSNFPLLIVVLLLVCIHAKANSELSDNMRISSINLSYDINYRVYLPEHYTKLQQLPVIYVTDGQSYIHSGRMPQLIDRLIEEKKIEPLIAVFIDPRDPDNPEINRRNYEFFCNPQYAEFVSRELVTHIDSNYKTAKIPGKRTILGLSFGGLNSACFGLLAHDVFTNIGMLSPAMHPVAKIYEYYEKEDKLPLNFFLSTGTIDDNERKTMRFRNFLKKKGYTHKFKKVRESHDWDNWGPLLDDVLIYFYPYND